MNLHGCYGSIFLGVAYHTHRIHGAGIYANIGGILMVNVTIYSSTMDPMGYIIFTVFHTFDPT